MYEDALRTDKFKKLPLFFGFCPRNCHPCGDNSYHVVTSNGMDATGMIDSCCSNPPDHFLKANEYSFAFFSLNSIRVFLAFSVAGLNFFGQFSFLFVAVFLRGFDWASLFPSASKTVAVMHTISLSLLCAGLLKNKSRFGG